MEKLKRYFFYLISLVCLLSVIGTLYGMFAKNTMFFERGLIVWALTYAYIKFHEPIQKI